MPRCRSICSSLASTVLRKALLIFVGWQVFWLNIFIPGHTRGAYGTVGDAPKASQTKISAARSCCSVPEAPADPSDDGKPTEDQKRRCVVCQIAKGYTVATVFWFDFSLSGRVESVIDRTEPQVTSILFDFPFYPVGPPAV